MTSLRHINDDGRVHAVAVACHRDDRWLLIRRSATVSAPLAVAFPGGTLEAGETQVDAVIREMREELDAIVEPISAFWVYSFEDRPLTLWGWHAKLLNHKLTPSPAEVAQILWLRPDQAAQHPDRTPQMAEFIRALTQYVNDENGPR
jgi:8-oxo-dGTP pyrophosphatase MutT (NUDIX family)